MVVRRFLLSVGLLVGGATAAQSQASPDTVNRAPATRDSTSAGAVVRDSASRWQTSIWGGAARGSSNWGILGASYGMNFGVLGVRFSRPRSQRAEGHPEWAWTFDLIPLAIISPPSISDPTKRCPPGNVCLKPDKKSAATTDAGLPECRFDGLACSPC